MFPQNTYPSVGPYEWVYYYPLRRIETVIFFIGHKIF